MSAHSAAAIADHSRALADRLGALTQAVLGAVDDGDDGATEAMALFGWYRSDLLPQLKAMESAVYTRGRERETTALLVQALLDGQDRLRELCESLDAVDGPGQAAGTATAVQVLYAAHSAQESDRLLPELVRLGVDFDEVVADRPELAGGERKRITVKAHLVTDPDGAPLAIDPVTGTEELDVRPMSHEARHGVILGKMQALTATGQLIIVNDHDPLPLKYQAEAMWPDQFAWTYLDEGPVEWRVAIARV